MYTTLLSSGVAGPTLTATLSDTAKSLNTDLLIPLTHATSSRRLVGLLVSVETYAARVAFGGATAVQSTSIIGHNLAAGSTTWLQGAYVAKSSWINSTNAQNAVLRLTPFYE